MEKRKNRNFLLIVAFGIAWAFFQPLPAMAFGYREVVAQARQLARHEYQQEKEIPGFLKNITYDQLRDIRFKDSDTLWGHDKVPFKVRFFHLGFYYHWPVKIHYVDGRGVHLFRFSRRLFNYGKNDFAGKVPDDLGFAGFRIHYPINTPHYDDEIAAFLGASYFRALGKNQRYGMSARGLAIDTAVDTGEEFPFFKEFWIVKPGWADKKITVFALLDSPSAAGAYQFIIFPGRQTVMDVKSTLFFRKGVHKLGIAPLTSMFLYGENSKPTFFDGLRPEVHDSDGLSIFLGTGEWLWRPLSNPGTLSVNTFEGTPKGFGLLQRDTNFDHYQDLESRYDLRPSVWVMTSKDWGAGHIELMEIPSSAEKNDNINAFWVPAKPPKAGQSLKFSYRLEWCRAFDKRPPEGYVVATRIERGKGEATFEVDFEGPRLKALGTHEKIEADIHVSQGYRATEHQVFKNTVTGGWRLVFHIEQKPSLKTTITNAKPSVGLRAFLKKGKQTLTETWDYDFMP